jgi:hypothetical protein
VRTEHLLDHYGPLPDPGLEPSATVVAGESSATVLPWCRVLSFIGYGRRYVPE